ncbi:MAG TPA: tRNA epoxyqueuosine(34) reductase QueG [Chloroflexota bacterium]|nr:tRNA epoxyqueuosine(34) reductase QueG [Chloroflexota bacterium]
MPERPGPRPRRAARAGSDRRAAQAPRQPPESAPTPDPAPGGPAAPDRAALALAVKAHARALGFDLAGIADAAPFADAEARTLAWLGRGGAAGMAWLTAERVRRACRPAELLPGARSFIAVGIGYRPAAEGRGEEGLGHIARYAQGRDYHDVLKPRLWALVRFLEERLGRPVAARVFVDDGPCPDRAVAQRAGLGFFGKNTNLLTRTHGSYVLLGAALTDVPLPPDPPAIADCGACTLCLDACPTGALPAPYVVDSARCISYLTIEHRGPLPEALRPLVGDHLFGCDVCQEVCPWNRLAAPTREPAFAPEAGAGAALDPVATLTMDEAAYRERLRGSPLKRAKRQGLRRNAALVLGGRDDPAAMAALALARDDPDPVVAEQAAWSLAQLTAPEAQPPA